MNPANTPATESIPAPPPRRRVGRGKRLVFASLAIGLAALFPVATFFVYAFFVQYRIWLAKQPRVAAATENVIARRDPRLGWVPIASAVYKDFSGPGKDLHINRAGVRAVRESARQGTAGRPRALCLGDSFMFGLLVGDDETFPAQLERIAGIETINLGMPGYGIDQCTLRYQAEMDNFDHQYVILGLITDDFRRVLNDRGAFGFYKPRYIVNRGALELIGVPTPPPLAVGEVLYPETRWQFVADRYPLLGRAIPRSLLEGRSDLQDNPEASQKLGQRILMEFQKLCAGRGKQLLIVWMPAWQDIKVSQSHAYYIKHHEAFTTFARGERLVLLDLSGMMENAPDAEVEKVFLSEPYHHPSPEGYRRFAQKTAEKLKDLK